MDTSSFLPVMILVSLSSKGACGRVLLMWGADLRPQDTSVIRHPWIVLYRVLGFISAFRDTYTPQSRHVEQSTIPNPGFTRAMRMILLARSWVFCMQGGGFNDMRLFPSLAWMNGRPISTKLMSGWYERHSLTRIATDTYMVIYPW